MYVGTVHALGQLCHMCNHAYKAHLGMSEVSTGLRATFVTGPILTASQTLSNTN